MVNWLVIVKQTVRIMVNITIKFYKIKIFCQVIVTNQIEVDDKFCRGSVEMVGEMRFTYKSLGDRIFCRIPQ